MLPKGYEGLVVADTRRALAWERGLERAGFDVVRVETAGADAAKGDWQIAVARADAPAAKAFVSEVVRGDRQLPGAVVLSRSAWISLVAILVIAVGLWLVLAVAG
jgi:hypothetical protein